MKDFQKIDWIQYNKPPFYQQWLCREETLQLATFGDKGLAEVDDHILSLKDQWDLNNAECYFLDRIGKILDEPRNGNTDEYYRTLLNLRRLLNTNNGSIPSIIKAIKFFYSSEVIHIVPNYPAGLIIEHDGEGTPGLNFNKLLSEIIPAGVSFNTKELFFFTEEIIVSDLLKIVVRRNAKETFGNPIKYNGMIKYDGYSTNTLVVVNGTYNGQFRYNGSITYNGTGMANAEYFPTPPFKYSSGIVDDLIYDSSESEAIEIEVMDDDAFIGIRKHHFFNGVYTYNGSIKYDSMVLIPAE